MDNRTSRTPGITIGGIELVELHFKINPKFILKEKKLKLPRINVLLDTSDLIENKFCVGLQISLDFDPDDKPFDLSLVMAGHFIKEENMNLDLKTFQEINAPTILFPYIREAVANITNRTCYPVLNLPPINVHILAKKKAAETIKES